MNRKEWEAERARLHQVYADFVVKHFSVFLIVDAERAKLRELEELHAELLRRRDELKEASTSALPEGHVRCSAMRNGCYLCDEIAPRKPLPAGWVENITGGVFFCPAHAHEVEEIDRPAIEAPLHRYQEVWDFQKPRR